MARKTKEEAQATRELLLDTAEQLFSTHGVSHTSLNDIARAASLTRGAVYWHFDNKADLLKALWERVALPLQQGLEAVDREQASNPRARIVQKACWMADHIGADAHMLAIMNILMLRCEFTAETEGARAHFREVREECLAGMTDEFRTAIAQQQLPLTLDAERSALGLFGLVDGLCFHWLIDRERFCIQACTRAAVEAYLSGLECTR
ncbi:TetR family transcriptional regulator [Uliginosibacterium aquaticum]|uniref:TetR family transcriptional regulator n=1 Tax=Uliginosibacterium aquaticum TaxID=2731212 RepID=A0ABX2IIR3_9RHOO|nr:TetR family transcriptional regulator [Uliginosibacterium aquaticum]NSL56182.1 TetR family transcriptional regulator [Uliginosibacterium aquaticum]